MNDMLFNVAAINLRTEAEGPGKRLAIWFQGCDINCIGCCNPQFQTIEPKYLLTRNKLISIIHKSFVENNIEGVTYLGGEPTFQQNLISLSESIQKMGLGIILFTGKEISEVDAALLKCVDLVVDGKYDPTLPDARNLIGSSNQNIIFMTDRYRSEIDWFLTPRTKLVEVNVLENSAIFSGDVL